MNLAALVVSSSTLRRIFSGILGSWVLAASVVHARLGSADSFLSRVPGSHAASSTSVLYHGSRTTPRVALTFDACPGSASRFDRGVIEVLQRTHTPATLFLSGRWMERFPEETRELAHDPLFELAVHGHRHRNWLQASDDALSEEMTAPVDILLRLTGRIAAWVRPPFGWVDERAARVAHQKGLLPVQFDLPSGDPDPGIPAKRLKEWVIQGAKNGSIVVFHMNGKGHHTAEVLSEVIQGIRARHLELVTVGTLLEQDPRDGLAGHPRLSHE